MKRARPAGACLVCGYPETDLSRIEYKCSNRPSGGKRCEGSRGSRTDLTDWIECPDCGASADVSRCERCYGFGWIDVRDKPNLRAAIERQRD